MAIEHAKFRMRHSILNPHDSITCLLDFFNQALAFVGKFLRIRRTGAKHHLGVLIDLRDSLNELADALLARNAAHKKHERTLRIHAPLLQDFFVECRLVKVRINTIVDNLHTIFRHAVKFHHIALHAFAHGNHAISGFVSGALNPAAHVIAAITELFGLPRTVRFERVRRQNQRALQKATCDHATKMAVPCMAMNHIDILERGHPLQINIERLQDFLETFISRIMF